MKFRRSIVSSLEKPGVVGRAASRDTIRGAPRGVNRRYRIWLRSTSPLAGEVAARSAAGDGSLQQIQRAEKPPHRSLSRHAREERARGRGGWAVPTPQPFHTLPEVPKVTSR